MSNFIDLTKQKFGRLTVIKRAEDWIQPSGKHVIQWLCECDCKNKTRIIVRGSHLRSKHTKSCGCLQEEVRHTNHKKYNTYDLTGEYGIGYTSNTNNPFLFDLEDYDKIKNYCWLETDKGYIMTTTSDEVGVRKFIHNLIMPNAYIVDHINGNKKDNRKSKLREANHSTNAMNCRGWSHNQSGVTGVYFNKEKNRWFAQITVNKKNNVVGRFKDFTNAVKARLIAEQELFGDFAYKPNAKILDYISNGGVLEPYNREQIENIINS